MKILSVVNQKGGVGKTTTSINLSACLYKMKRRVLLVDLDPQSNATRGSGIDASMIQNSINDVLLDRVNIEKAIIKSQFDGYDILPATPSLTESEVVLVTRDEREFILKNKLTSSLVGMTTYYGLPTLTEYSYSQLASLCNWSFDSSSMRVLCTPRPK